MPSSLSEAQPQALPLSPLGAGYPFDPAFYVATYADVAGDGGDPAEHYVHFGRRERRYACEAQLRSDIEAVEASGILADPYWRARLDGRATRDRLLDMAAGVPPARGFEPGFVMAYYRRTLVAGENLFAFFCRHWRKPWCYASGERGAGDFARVRDCPLFDERYFLASLGRSLPEIDAATYYVTEGFRIPCDPSRSFSGRGYLEDFPDIASAELNPLLHYLQFGEVETRRLAAADRVEVLPGLRRRAGRPTLLICSHEASRSGAPAVGLNLARHFAEAFDVVSLLFRPGPLLEDFKALSTEVIVSGDHPSALRGVASFLAERDVAAAVLNSVETVKLLPAMVEAGVPTVSLVHEFAQYVHPFDMVTRAVALSDRALFPARVVEAAALREMAQGGFTTRDVSNVTLRPQGRPLLRAAGAETPATRPPVAGSPFTVLGAGWVQPRKGVDLFIEAARVLTQELGVAARFVWVGGNYAPRHDLLVSAYLQDQVEASGLADAVRFVPEQADLEPFWRAADAFFMSSRLDPFPNVALDAIHQGVPLVCFERATGIAELAELWPQRVKAAPYNDARRAAELLAEIAGGGGKLPVSADVERRLSFAAYAADVREVIEGCIARRPTVDAVEQALAGNSEPSVMAATLPSTLAMSGVVNTAAGVRRLYALAASNGVRLGRVRLDRSAAPPADGDWSKSDLTVVTPGGAEPELCAVCATEDGASLDTLARLALARPRASLLVMVSDSLGPGELEPLRGLAEDVRLLPRRGAAEATYALLRDRPFLLWTPSDAPSAGARELDALCATLGACAASKLVLLARGAADPAPARLRASPASAADGGLLDRRLVHDDAALVAPARWAQAPALLEAVLAPDRLDPALVWDGLIAVGGAPEGAWALCDDGDEAPVRDYDILWGREPILRPRTRAGDAPAFR